MRISLTCNQSLSLYSYRTSPVLAHLLADDFTRLQVLRITMKDLAEVPEFQLRLQVGGAFLQELVLDTAQYRTYAFTSLLLPKCIAFSATAPQLRLQLAPPAALGSVEATKRGRSASVGH